MLQRYGLFNVLIGSVIEQNLLHIICTFPISLVIGFRNELRCTPPPRRPEDPCRASELHVQAGVRHARLLRLPSFQSSDLHLVHLITLRPLTSSSQTSRKSSERFVRYDHY